MASRTYRIHEFAELAGVSVRALHHYDRLGLLKPRRAPNGYRLYSTKDLETLEQIVALKFIGVSLDQIRTFGRRSAVDLSTALRAQRTILEQKKRLLEQTIAAIGQAEHVLQVGRHADRAVFRRIIEVITMQNERRMWKRKYAELMQGKNERLPPLSPEARTRLREQFAKLFADAEGALGEDPANPHVRALADRYVELLRMLAP